MNFVDSGRVRSIRNRSDPIRSGLLWSVVVLSALVSSVLPRSDVVLSGWICCVLVWLDLTWSCLVWSGMFQSISGLAVFDGAKSTGVEPVSVDLIECSVVEQNRFVFDNVFIWTDCF